MLDSAEFAFVFWTLSVSVVALAVAGYVLDLLEDWRQR